MYTRRERTMIEMITVVLAIILIVMLILLGILCILYFKSKNKIHPATLKSILNKVDNGTQLSLREQEMFDFYKKTELVSSTKIKSKSNKGKDKSNENTCK